MKFAAGLWLINSLIEAVIMVLIGLLSYEDIRKRSISILGPVILLGIGIAQFFLTGCGITELLYGIIPGVMFMAVALGSKDTVGMGDGLVILGIGICEGIFKTMRILIIAGMAAMLYSLFLIIVKKKGRRHSIPFIPFLLIGMVGGLV